jgi:nucleoside-diphosphate-sugar epimerase
MNISVVGYQGFIGSAIVRAMERRGLRPSCIGRNDLINSKSELIIDCNGNSSKFQTNNNPNLGLTEIVGAVSERIKQVQKRSRYIYISSGEVYGHEQHDSKESDKVKIEELSLYGNFKYQAEELVTSQLLNYLIIRPSGFVGEGLKKNPIFDLLNNSRIFVHQESEFQFCDVDWFADLVVTMALTEFVGVLNVSATGSVSIKEVTEKLRIPPPLVESGATLEIHKLNTELLSNFIEVPSTFIHVQNYILGVQGQNA